jgi:hypothetical protein
MKNKKGALAVGVIVVMTILLFSYLFFKVITNSADIKNNLNPVLYSGYVYAEKESYENSLYLILFEDFLNSYQKVLGDSSEKIGREKIDLNESFEQEFKENFDRVVVDSKKFVGGGKNNSFLLFLSENNYDVKFDGNYSSVVFPEWTVERIVSGENFVRSKYTSSVESSVGFEKLGLLSFNQIKGIYCECLKSLSMSDTEKCFRDEFRDFNVTFSDRFFSGNIPTVSGAITGGMGSSANVVSSLQGTQSPSWRVVLVKSKEKYYVDGEMKNIEFNLVFDYFEQGETLTNLNFCI